MLDKEHKNIDAVSVSTPDNVHAVAAFAAMQLGKHVYVQKPLTHDIYEARMLTEAAKRYKVVTQMGNQGASGDGVRQMREWYNAGIIGDATALYIWTNRPVWPQGTGYPTTKDDIPKELDWDLWLGPAQTQDYHKEFVPFSWRGFWAFGTGALGDMGCHLIDPAFKTVGLGYPSGPLAWGDAIGASTIARILDGLLAATGDPRYRASSWLARRATLGLSLTHAD